VLRNEGYRAFFVRMIRKALFLFNLGYLADADLCPTGALTPPDLSWPRVLRAQFSNPTVVHPGTGVPGGGTDEIKSNDVWAAQTGAKWAVVEIGRPGTAPSSATSRRWRWPGPARRSSEPENPVTLLIEDLKTGRMKADVPNERSSRDHRAQDVIEKIPDLGGPGKARHRIDPVISIGVASRCLPDGTIPHEEWVRKAGYALSSNGKTNLGLGRPLFREDEP
jgi:hypothetical protein